MPIRGSPPAGFGENPTTEPDDTLIFSPHQYIEHASVPRYAQWGFDENSRVKKRALRLQGVGIRVRSKERDLGSRRAGVRRFESGPTHFFIGLQVS